MLTNILTISVVHFGHTILNIFRLVLVDKIYISVKHTYSNSDLSCAIEQR